jgi:adenylate cyclase
MALSHKKSRRTATGLGVLLMLFVLALEYGSIPGMKDLFQRLELFVYNQRMQAHVPNQVAPDGRIVIVDIDESSLHEIGRWPWSRRTIGELITKLHQAGAVVVALDMLLAEPERNPAQEFASRLPDTAQYTRVKKEAILLAPLLDADSALADTIRHSEVILGYVFDPARNEVTGELPLPLPLTNPQLVPQLALPTMAGYTGSVPLLQQATSSGGFFSLFPDIDGVVRRVPLFSRYEDQLYPSLALETVRRYLFLQQGTLLTKPINGKEYVEFLRFDDALLISTDKAGQMLVPYRGPQRSFPYLSAATVLRGDSSPKQLAGAIVLIGTTAAGLFDMRATPIDPVYPGVEVHANLIAAMLDNRYLVIPSWAKGANLMLSLLPGLLLILLLPRLSVAWLVLVSSFSTALIIGVTEWFWANEGLVLNLAGPLLLITLLVVGNLAWGFFFESLTRLRMKGIFGQYVPSELVEEMSERPDEYDTEGRARELTVLFSDIRSFTTISESLPADELKRYLNRFFTPMTRIIFNHHGTIDKYVGDMVMAFWGAPVDDPQHAVHAIEAALAMQIEVERLKHEFAALGWQPANIGIGINSGVMSVGDMGSEYRRSYTVLGDAVNLGSRLEGTTKYYGVGLIIGERTRELAGELFLYRDLDRIQVKGKAQAVQIFQPVCHRDKANVELLQEIEMLDQAQDAYRNRRWDEADGLFADLQEMQPGLVLYSIYRQRIGELREQTLDADWHGVYIRSEK